MLNGGRSARTRFRCTRPSMSRGHDRALNPVKGIDILVLPVSCGATTLLPERVIPARQGPLGPEGMGNPTGSQDHLRPEEAVKGTELLLEEAVRGTSAPSPKSPRRQSPAGPADRSCWEYAKTGKCQHGRDCRFEHDRSPRNPAAPSTPRTGDRPVRDKPMYFGYCYDWMYGKCTAQPCKYLHQKPPPGTKPMTPRTAAGPVVEDEEGDTPRSPTPSPPDREARRLDSPAQGLTDF